MARPAIGVGVISYDHRLVDGADADRFMIEVKRTLEEETWTELEPYS